jgi:hypothetical protein
MCVVVERWGRGRYPYLRHGQATAGPARVDGSDIGSVRDPYNHGGLWWRFGSPRCRAGRDLDDGPLRGMVQVIRRMCRSRPVGPGSRCPLRTSDRRHDRGVRVVTIGVTHMGIFV